MRVGVHGLKCMEPFGDFFASIVLILILGGFLIFEYTDLSIFITYKIDGYDLDSALLRIFGDFDHLKH